MGYYLEPGHMALVLLTPEQYHRMLERQQPNFWPAYFAMSQLGHTLQDLAMKAMVAGNIDTMAANINVSLGVGIAQANHQAEAGPEGDADHLRNQITAIYQGLYGFWKSGVWHGVGAAYASAVEQFIASGQLLYAYKTLMYHTAITPRLRRHWNKVYHPMEPSGSMAHILYQRGHYTIDQFKEAAAWDGWSPENAELLLKAMELLPTAREAFYLWTKGLIGLEDRNKLYFSGGYAQRWWEAVTENLYYVPTLYDLTRLADYIELDEIWATKQLRYRGLKDADAAKVLEMLTLRPLREEVRNLTTKWTWRYRYGRATLDEMRDAFTAMGIRKKERDLLLTKAEMDYEDELIDEWVEILRWRFRTAMITEKEFLDGLTELEIRAEKANLIVELEKAQGYLGY